MDTLPDELLVRALRGIPTGPVMATCRAARHRILRLSMACPIAVHVRLRCYPTVLPDCDPSTNIRFYVQLADGHSACLGFHDAANTMLDAYYAALRRRQAVGNALVRRMLRDRPGWVAASKGRYLDAAGHREVLHALHDHRRMVCLAVAAMRGLPYSGVRASCIAHDDVPSTPLTCAYVTSPSEHWVTLTPGEAQDAR